MPSEKFHNYDLADEEERQSTFSPNPIPIGDEEFLLKWNWNPFAFQDGLLTPAAIGRKDDLLKDGLSLTRAAHHNRQNDAHYIKMQKERNPASRQRYYYSKIKTENVKALKNPENTFRNFLVIDDGLEDNIGHTHIFFSKETLDTYQKGNFDLLTSDLLDLMNARFQEKALKKK